MFDEYALIRQIQEFFGLGAKPFFWIFNTLWGLGLATYLPAMIFWLGCRKIGFRAGLFDAITGPIIVYSKWIIAEPRPFYVSDAFTPLKVSTGFGMPSGNALGIATLWSTIAWYARQKWIWGLAALFILFTGLARVFYGVHSPSQVVVGWLVGIALVVVLVKIAEPFVCWFRDRSLAFQIASVVITALCVALFGVAIDYFMLQNFAVPDSWVERYNALAAEFDEEDKFTLFSVLDSYVLGGYLLGFGLSGIALLRDAVPENITRLGKALNVGLGLVFLYAFGIIYPFFAGTVRGTMLFAPYLMAAFAIFPLLAYVVTPVVADRVIRVFKPGVSEAKKKGR